MICLFKQLVIKKTQKTAHTPILLLTTGDRSIYWMKKPTTENKNEHHENSSNLQQSRKPSRAWSLKMMFLFVLSLVLYAALPQNKQPTNQRIDYRKVSYK